MSRHNSMRQNLLRQIDEQLKWIDKCGGTLQGYIAKYGDVGVPPLDDNGQPKTVTMRQELAESLVPVPGTADKFFHPHSGNGGAAIYLADIRELHRLEQCLQCC